MAATGGQRRARLASPPNTGGACTDRNRRAPRHVDVVGDVGENVRHVVRCRTVVREVQLLVALVEAELGLAQVPPRLRGERLALKLEHPRQRRMKSGLALAAAWRAPRRQK